MDPDHLQTRLCQAAFKDDLEFIKMISLCEGNTDLNKGDYDLRTVGHLAACEKRANILRFLATDTNFDFNKKDRFGSSTFDEIQKNIVDKVFEEEIKDLLSKNPKQSK